MGEKELEHIRGKVKLDSVQDPLNSLDPAPWNYQGSRLWLNEAARRWWPAEAVREYTEGTVDRNGHGRCWEILILLPASAVPGGQRQRSCDCDCSCMWPCANHRWRAYYSALILEIKSRYQCQRLAAGRNKVYFSSPWPQISAVSD